MDQLFLSKVDSIIRIRSKTDKNILIDNLVLTLIKDKLVKNW